MAADADGNYEIDIDAMARKIEEKLSGEMPISPQCSIVRIPTTLLRQNLNAYVPDGFSFGPFHHGKENLEHTEKIKAEYLRDLIARLSPPNDPNLAYTRTLWIKKFTAAISNKRKEARECYCGPIGMEEGKFIEVLVLDGCFIIELFRRKAYEGLKEENDQIFAMSCRFQFLWHDLILLENQIPWVVLDILFDMTLSSIDEKSLVQLAVEFFGNIFSIEPTPIHRLLFHPSKHILDFLRNSLVLNSSILESRYNPELDSLELEPMPSAKSLLDSGIRFKMGMSKSILDIRFHQGILEIPTLFIQETTETIFRNLISLEQCCPNYDPIITSYAVLFNNLMKSKDDMEILSNSRAIYNWLNIDDATRLFNKLCTETFVMETFYLKLTHEVNEYCRHRWQRYRRVLVRDYLHDPWTFTSVNVAIIALILTFVQTVFAIIKK